MSENKHQFKDLKTQFSESEIDFEELAKLKTSQVKLYIGSLPSEEENGDSDGDGVGASGSNKEDTTWQDIPSDINSTIDFFNQLDILNKAALMLINGKHFKAVASFKNMEPPKDQVSSDISTLADDEKSSEEQTNESRNENQLINMEGFHEPESLVHKWCIVKWLYVVFVGALLVIGLIVLLNLFFK